ncbi:hypothetical protein [Streptomyces sp. NPDC088752]|uniref:hypothetical protein n=1 Tax=Streptomyces sp. NPDC088752 TaxID=3154963 RepID=UPI003413685A
MIADTPPFKVRPQQTYVPCRQWNWQPSRPFVVELVEGGRVKVWEPFGGPSGLGCHRWVALASLHESGTTRTGKERQTGWRLHAGPPSQGQELCGSCMTWVDRDQLAVSAWGYGHSTCAPCKTKIDQVVGI